MQAAPVYPSVSNSISQQVLQMSAVAQNDGREPDMLQMLNDSVDCREVDFLRLLPDGGLELPDGGWLVLAHPVLQITPKHEVQE